MSLRTVIQELGLRDGLLYAAHRALSALSGGRARIVKYYLVAQPIGRPGTRPMRPDAATTLLDVPAAHPLRAAFPRPDAVLNMRYAAGARCTTALVRDAFAGFIWIQRGRYDEDELRCGYVLEQPALCVWDYDVYVEPKYRIGRTMARLWSHVDAELAASGVRWSYSRISAFNAASLASHARLGIVRCGSALFLCIGALQLSWLPGAWWPHLSRSRAPVWRLPLPPGEAGPNVQD